MQNSISNIWKQDKLENLLSLIIDHRGKTPKKLGGNWSSEGTPALSAKNIKFGKLVNKNIRFVNSKLYEKWMPVKLEKDDILLTSEAPLGELYFLKEKKDYVLSQRVFGLRTKQNILNSKYLYYFLNSSTGRHELIRRTSGTAAEGIRQSELLQIKIDYPDDTTMQKKIVEIPSLIDDKIEINNNIAKTLEELAQAVFKEWLIYFRFPRYKKVKFMESELGEIPVGWSVNAFGEYARLEYGKALKENRRIAGKVWVYGSSGIVGTHNEKLCDAPGIVVGRKGNVGSVFWIENDFYPIDTTFYVTSKISSYYIYFILKNMRFHSGDSAVPGLNRESVHNQTIIIPAYEILGQFDKLIKPIFAKLQFLKEENQKLAALHDLLLPKLMKGEIRI